MKLTRCQGIHLFVAAVLLLSRAGTGLLFGEDLELGGGATVLAAETGDSGTPFFIPQPSSRNREATSGNRAPSTEQVPSVSVPLTAPQNSSQEVAPVALPEPTPPAPSGSIITVRSFHLPEAEPPATVQDPPAVPEGAPKPEPPAFIRPAETKPAPPLGRQVLPPETSSPREAPISPVVPVFQVEEPPKATYSRQVEALLGQLVEIPFRGTGWVYLGEQQSKPGIAYHSRYLEKDGQTFVFRTEASGTYTLTFYKQDFIEDYIVNDAVQVQVNPILEQGRVSLPSHPDRVIAEPRWPSLPGEAAETSTPGPAVSRPLMEPTPTAVSVPETLPDPQLSVDYVQQARDAYSAGEFPQALASLDRFREQYPAGTDEAWWLYGQCLEAASPNRDIRSALEYYYRLIREYPQSLRGNDARRRIAYLERYYVTIQ